MNLNSQKLCWSADFAYTVGLITTDGSLSKDGRHLVLTSNDKGMLKTFLNCLCIKNKIIKNQKGTLTRNQSYKIQLGNVRLYRWLLKIGLTPNKTLTLGPLTVPNKFFPDFLRGHLDGDGSIITYTDKYNQKISPKYIYRRLFVYFVSGSKNHLDWLRERIFLLLQIKGSLSKILAKNGVSKSPVWRIKFSTKEAKTILNYIYYKNNLPSLKRKLKLALPFLNTASLG